MKGGFFLNPKYMKRAIELAKKGIGYTNPNPIVGCVVVKNDEIISEGYHEKIGGFHAERNALTNCKEDTTGAELYVTLEPCPMCAGAIINSHIDRVVFGAKDSSAGAFGSIINLTNYPIGFKPKLTGGVLKDDCAEMLRHFFSELRNKKKG